MTTLAELLGQQGEVFIKLCHDDGFPIGEALTDSDCHIVRAGSRSSKFRLVVVVNTFLFALRQFQNASYGVARHRAR